MSSAVLNKAALIMGPNDLNRTANDFRCLHFTAGTSVAVNAIPNDWRGAYVRIKALVGNVAYAFSERSDAIVDITKAAAAAGEEDTVGWHLSAGETVDDFIPATLNTLYLVRDGDNASGTLLIQKRS